IAPAFWVSHRGRDDTAPESKLVVEISTWACMRRRKKLPGRVIARLSSCMVNTQQPTNPWASSTRPGGANDGCDLWRGSRRYRGNRTAGDGADRRDRRWSVCPPPPGREAP